MSTRFISFCVITCIFFMSCDDASSLLEEELTVSTKNSLYELELSVSNNITDSNIPISFESKVTRIEIDSDTLQVNTDPVSDSAENDLYRLDLNLTSGATDYATPVEFNISVIRTKKFTIRPDLKVVGYWSLYQLEIDGDKVNVAQFPEIYEFFPDSAFSLVTVNTLTGDTSYVGGAWEYEPATATGGTMKYKQMGKTIDMTISFDHASPIIPLDGFMIWSYSDGGFEYYKALVKVEATDLSGTGLIEPQSFLLASAGGGEIPEYATNETPLYLDNEIGASYDINGFFKPDENFSKGIVIATLLTDSSYALNVSANIQLYESLYDTLAFTYMSFSTVGGELVVSGLEDPLVPIFIDLPNLVGKSYTASGSFIPGTDFVKGSIDVSLKDKRYSTLNLSVPIKINQIENQ